MHRHFFASHRNEPEVEEIAGMPKQSEKRRLALNLLNLKGDFLHNVAVLSSESVCLFLLRRSDANKPTDYSQYIPCIYCLGFVHVERAYRHADNCKKKKEFVTTKTKCFTQQGRFLLSRINARGELIAEWQSVLAELKNDEIGEYVRKDPTLNALGNTLTIKKGYDQRRHIRDKLRLIATFCINYHKEYGTEDRSVKEIFHTNNFQKCLCLAQTTWGDAPTPAIKMGQAIKEVLIVFKQDAIVENYTDRKTECENFQFLVDSKWSQIINSPHIRNLKKQKAKVVEMPVTSDITQFLKYLDDEIKSLVSELRLNGHSNIWKQLVKACLAYLIVFNRRREGEV